MLVGREHDPEGRQHTVEGPVAEGQVLDVAFVEAQVEALDCGALPRALEQRRHIVEPDGLATAPCGGEGGVAAAGRDVENLAPGAQVHRLAKQLGHDEKRRRHRRVVAGSPHLALPALDHGQVGHMRKPAPGAPCRPVQFLN